MAILVSQVMASPVISVRPNDTLDKINTLLHKNKIHHVIVIDENKLIAGIVSDRDILSAISPFLGTSVENKLDRSTLEKTAWQLMKPNPVVAKVNNTIPEAASLLIQSNISCLPIIDMNGFAVGMLSWKDILKVIARAKS